MDESKMAGGAAAESAAAAAKRKFLDRLRIDIPQNVGKDDVPPKSVLTAVCEISPTTMREVGARRGDYVAIRGKKQAFIICSAASNENVKDGTIWLNKVNRQMLSAYTMDEVVVRPVSVRRQQGLFAAAGPGDGAKEGTNCIMAKRVVFSACKEETENFAADAQSLRERFLVPYFEQSQEMTSKGVPLMVGQIFFATAAGRDVHFKVESIESSWNGAKLSKDSFPGKTANFGMVHLRTTQIHLNEEKISLEQELKVRNRTGYADIGGLSEQLKTIRDNVELPLRHPKLFTTLGVKPPKGVLMSGPPGCGKTLIARAIANESNARMFIINGPEIIGAARGESEENLRKLFKNARENAPAIIFVDEIDAIAPNRDKVKDETMSRVVATLLTEMDGVKSSAHLIVIGATNRPNSLDPALRRAGRFDTEIQIPVPTHTGRIEILRIVTRKMKLADDVDLKVLAERTHGYVGADLANLCTKAGLRCVRKMTAEMEMESGEIDINFLDDLRVTMEDFNEEIGNIKPSSLKDSVVEIPNVSFADIGGLEDVKAEMKDMIEMPVKFPELFEQLGTQPPRGALFYGPPGCGKTLMAKAMANECGSNFISVKGPELLSKWVGESEENVRDLFTKARQAAPCIIFFDELDALASARGGSTTGLGDKVVNQLLTEMDGIGERKNVFCIGATNRKNLLDPAILRPGRLDQHIFIPMPDTDARASIFKACLRKAQVEDGIAFDKLAAATEGYTGADLNSICQKAVKLAVRERIMLDQAKEEKDQGDEGVEEQEPKPIVINDRHLEAGFKATPPSVSKRDILFYQMQAQETAAKTGGKASMLAKDDMSEVTGRYLIK